MLLALIAMGLSIIFGLMDIINFAHGAYYTLGAYVALTSMGFIDSFWVAMIVVPATVMVVGFFVEFVFLRRLYGKDPVFSLLLNFGVMLGIIQVIRLVWGVAYRPFSPPEILSGAAFLGFAYFSVYRIFVVAVCIFLAILVWLFLKKTSVGMTVRAAVDKRDMVKALGINVSAVFTLVFGIGVALAGLAGALAAPLLAVFPEMGVQILVESFVVVVIGGMGIDRCRHNSRRDHGFDHALVPGDVTCCRVCLHGHLPFDKTHRTFWEQNIELSDELLVRAMYNPYMSNPFQEKIES
jgi:branched-chain amino acid transport system permease protein